MAFTISNSALMQFYSGCPARFEFFKRYSMKQKFMPRHLRFGIAVHEALQKDLEGVADAEVRMTAERLLNLSDKNGYQILATEIKHFAPLTDDIDVFGIIDVLALTQEGKLVLLDWKTGSYPWETTKLASGELVTMKARGWQGAIYTLPPYKMPIGWKEWPQEMHYLTAPTNGGAQIHKYYAWDEDLENLRRAATMMKEAVDGGALPKNIGYECRECDWQKVCWETPGWDKYYDERRGAREEEEADE